MLLYPKANALRDPNPPTESGLVTGLTGQNKDQGGLSKVKLYILYIILEVPLCLRERN